MQAFNNEKKTQLNSLGRQIREYTRRNNLEANRENIEDMLTTASDLLAFFKDNGVVTNSAFQTTLSLRLSLLLELHQLLGLEQLEAPFVVVVVEQHRGPPVEHIRQQRARQALLS